MQISPDLLVIVSTSNLVIATLADDSHHTTWITWTNDGYHGVVCKYLSVAYLQLGAFWLNGGLINGGSRLDWTHPLTQDTALDSGQSLVSGALIRE